MAKRKYAKMKRLLKQFFLLINAFNYLQNPII